MAAIRLAVPDTAQRGEVIEIKALIQHPMESGFRRGSRGEVIPRNIITRFECRYNGALVFASDFQPAIAANPILTFHTVATETGELEFKWTDQNGEAWSEIATITVT
ncbi:MAG: thiosulfate oxidation carrier complex protein SoxZ [Hyphomonadaceae bacterium]|nr:thiosulfate oxidation carrier complex protein SoxZ [Hyphomonadaceae bacterium]